MAHRAVVLGIEHPRGVAVVRSLARRGIPVVAVETSHNARGLRSRYLNRALVVDGGPADIVAALESLGRAGGGVLIPTNDQFLVLVSRYYERLAALFSVTVPPWGILERLMDKPACYRLAEDAGVATPRFFVPHSALELDRAVARLDFAACRYILSVRMPGGSPADVRTRRLTKVAGEDAETVRRACLDIAVRTGEFPMIAEVIPGRSDRCVGVSMVVNREHVPVLAYGVRRLQLYLYAQDSGFTHPYELGANVYCESVRDEEAVETATRFVRRARFFGAITVEFRRDSRDGTLKLIKADPRVVRATSLSSALGLDVPTAIYRVFTTGHHDVAASYSQGVAWIWPSMYLETIWNNRERISLSRQLWAVLKNIHRVRSFAYWSLRDPAPAVVDMKRLARRAWGPIAHEVLPRRSMVGRLARAAWRRWPARG